MRNPTAPELVVEHLSGSVERVTFHSEESGFCVLRVKVKGTRDLITVVGSAASITPGEFVECVGTWHNDKSLTNLAGRMRYGNAGLFATSAKR